MASNPFLSMSEEFAPAADTAASNPFLTGDFGSMVETYGETSDNPFTASNPFSDFGGGDYETAVAATTAADIFGFSDPIATTAANFFSTTIHDTGESEVLFSTAQSTIPEVVTSNFFDTTIQEQPPIPTSVPQKPTDLDLSYKISSDHEDVHMYVSDDESSKPSRPPPPSRPIAPETKDLILSVTGHMELTTGDLLDRIPPTRTPSPVSMRDLHSPSPTPDSAFGDLLGDKSLTKEGMISSDEAEVNLFDVDDVVTQYSCSPQQNSSPPTDPETLSNQNKPSTAEASRETSPREETANGKPKPPRPGPPPPMRAAIPPARPAPPPTRPSPPQKPPPPSMPQRPAVPPPPVAAVTTQPQDNEFSLFDAPVHKAPAKKGTEDILSLYAPKKEAEKPVDFLMDDFEETVQQTEKPQEVPAAVAKSPEAPQPMDITPSAENTPMTENIPTEPFGISQPASAIENEFTISEPAPVESAFNIKEKSPIFEEQPFSYAAPDREEPSIYSQSVTSPQSNPFAAEVTPSFDSAANTAQSNIFGLNTAANNNFVDNSNAFGATETTYQSQQSAFGVEPSSNMNQFGSNSNDAFDAFSAKFESTTQKETGAFDAFGGGGGGGGNTGGDDAWGSAATGFSAAGDGDGFGTEDNFDAFLTLNQPPPAPSATPAPFSKSDSQDSEEGNFNIFIKPKEGDVPFSYGNDVVPALAPPPKSPATAYNDSSPRFNPFDKSAEFAEAAFAAKQESELQGEDNRMQRSESQENPPTPLFDDDVSQPLEDFPRIHYNGIGWEVQLRQPNKKKITGQRFWKKIFIKLVYQGDNPVVQLYNSATDKEPFQELPLQACYSVSEIAAQQYDQYGKIFTVKLQYVFYKERPGVRPGQVTKAERITNKLSQFAAYAIQGDYAGVKEFGSDLKKLGLPVEHAPQISQLFKIGSTNYEDMKQFSVIIEEALFKLSAHRDRALNYKMEEVQITAVDELYVEQDYEGHVTKQIARVRLFFLGFLSGMPDVELGINDMWRQGKEVVGRHDILPVATEEWIRLEGVEFHSCIQPDEYQNTRIIRFKPPDACYIELFRFRVRPPKNRELPLQVKAVMCVTGNKVELRSDVLVPGFTSRSLGQVPCEDVMIRFPIPECWIYLFRVEKHFRYGSVKSAHRRTGKIKGIERFLGAVDTLQESLIEVTSGQAKYEHQHRSIVWRMSRLPKEGQGAYTTHNLVCRMALTSYDQIPEKLTEYCYVEFTMPATQCSHMTVRSVSLQNYDSDEPPEKYVRYLARHEYRVGIEHTQGDGPNAYLAATISKPIKEEPAPQVSHTPAAVSSDSDSD